MDITQDSSRYLVQHKIHILKPLKMYQRMMIETIYIDYFQQQKVGVQ